MRRIFYIRFYRRWSFLWGFPQVKIFHSVQKLLHTLIWKFRFLRCLKKLNLSHLQMLHRLQAFSVADIQKCTIRRSQESLKINEEQNTITKNFVKTLETLILLYKSTLRTATLFVTAKIQKQLKCPSTVG